MMIKFLEVPDGGDGGHGGDVYFRSTGRLSSLYDLRRAHFYGNNGKYGQVSNSIAAINTILI
jgi:GTPase involved in cell partitioning and DNA repair